MASLCGITRTAAQRLLQRMVDSEELKRADGISPYFYHLKSHKKAYNIFNYKHEKIGADIYVCLQEYIKYWSRAVTPDFISVKLKPDITSAFTMVVLWELDRSTMTQKKIADKILKYIRYAKKYNRKFNVIFACPKRRANTLLKLFGKYRNPNVWFFTVDYNES